MRTAAVVASFLVVAGCGDGGARARTTSSSGTPVSAEPARSGAAASVQVPTDDPTGRAREWPGPRQSATFAADGITKVVLRASQAKDATVRASTDGKITVSGVPVLVGIEGRPSSGAFDDSGFDSQRFDATLLVATKGEFFYIHFGTAMRDLVLEVPSGVEVVREAMVVNGDMKPDLRPPGSPPRPEGR